MTRQAVQKALDEKRIFAHRVKGRQWSVPAFFADAGLDRHLLEDVARALGDLPAASKHQFFEEPRGSLGGLTALEALRRGRLGQVLACAKSFAAAP